MLLRLVTPCNGLYIRHFRNRRKLERVNVKISGTITRDREKKLASSWPARPGSNYGTHFSSSALIVSIEANNGVKFRKILTKKGNLSWLLMSFTAIYWRLQVNNITARSSFLFFLLQAKFGIVIISVISVGVKGGKKLQTQSFTFKFGLVWDKCNDPLNNSDLSVWTSIWS